MWWDYRHSGGEHTDDKVRGLKDFTFLVQQHFGPIFGIELSAGFVDLGIYEPQKRHLWVLKILQEKFSNHTAQSIAERAIEMIKEAGMAQLTGIAKGVRIDSIKD